MIVIFELFSSLFLRSYGILITLLLGYIFSAITIDHNGDSYTNLAAVKEAPTIIFLWIRMFSVSFISIATHYHGCVHCFHFTEILFLL